jgi:hypothetical protein
MNVIARSALLASASVRGSFWQEAHERAGVSRLSGILRLFRNELRFYEVFLAYRVERDFGTALASLANPISSPQ